MGFALSEITLTSSAFQNLRAIPSQYTGEGTNVSPQLSWRSVPEDTREFAIVCHDPDAPLITSVNYGFVHWTLYNIPGSVRTLSEATSDYTTGRNDFGELGYGGPMPPSGHGLHHYYFWILALDQELNLPVGLTMAELFEFIEPSVIAMNRLIGTYDRQ